MMYQMLTTAIVLDFFFFFQPTLENCFTRLKKKKKQLYITRWLKTHYHQENRYIYIYIVGNLNLESQISKLKYSTSLC